MSFSKTSWKKWVEQILSPKINTDEVEAELNKVRGALPTPVFWLLGKTGSGKTSLIRAVTDNPNVVIGDGIKPCTKTAFLYDFPSLQNCLVRFLDTRGIGEADYDPTADMAVFSKQAHLLLVLVKATDHAQLPIKNALDQIRKQHPEWPIVIVQSCLHEGYPERGMNHALPYPFAQAQWEQKVAPDLARSLLHQRQEFGSYTSHFVPVDFTLVEDGYTPQNYGLDALWVEIEKVLPLGLRLLFKGTSSAQGQLKSLYAKAAHPHIIVYATLAGAAGAVPIPLVGLPVVSAVQAKMLQAIASIYNQTLSAKTLSEIGGALGVGLLLNWAGREAVKILPGYGLAVSSLYTAATTYALGHTLCYYFSAIEEGHLPTKEAIKALYQDQFTQGREIMQQYLKNLVKKSL